MKILIIDDNKEITDMLKQFLGISGFEVTISNDGKNGLNLLEKNNFDKILLDIAMSEFSGLDVIENLRLKNFTDFNKIIILTATTIDNDVAEKIKTYGINTIFEKPIKMTDLVEKIKN